MQSYSLSLWWLRIVTFSIAALAAASATYWLLQWNAAAPQSATASAMTTAAKTRQIDPQRVARLLGGGQTLVALSAADSVARRFKLTGVVATRSNGYAVISIDGKPARPYRVGTQVDEALVLRSVAPRSAALATSADAPAAFTLELPPPNAK